MESKEASTLGQRLHEAHLSQQDDRAAHLSRKLTSVLLSRMERDDETLLLTASRFPGITLLRFPERQRLRLHCHREGVRVVENPGRKPAVRTWTFLQTPGFRHALAAWMERRFGGGETRDGETRHGDGQTPPLLLVYLHVDGQGHGAVRMTWDGQPVVEPVIPLYPDC